MRVHQISSANLFLVIVLWMMAFECMPHLMHSHHATTTNQIESVANRSESAGATHSIYHIIEALSKVHASHPHEHNVTLTKASDKVSSIQYISLLLILIPLIQQVLSTKEKTCCIYTKPILYKGRFPSARALRGPPSHI